MTSLLYKRLEWLPAADAFVADCQAIANGEGPCGVALKTLATHSLNDTQLRRLSSLIRRVRQSERTMAPLETVRVGIVGNGTLDLVVPALEATAVRHGLLLDCVMTPYGQAVQDALSPASAIHQANCQIILMALDFRGIGLTPCPGDPERARHMIAEALGLVRRLQAALSANGAIVIVQTLAAPPETLFGSLDRALPGTLHQLIYAFNAALIAECEPGGALLDVAALAHTIGLDSWYSPTQWNMAKLPFSVDCVPIYAEHVCRLIAALRGRSRRVLILDLDNTLWGGVIGDDGLDGILLGEGDGTGEAFLSVQRYAYALRERGVILAVSSKNTDEVARQVFREHPEMLLREHHIAAFQANWDDKATNIRAIAASLSLGLDAMVFLDDNPVERGLVRTYLPEVAVPELPDDPSLYARVLAAAGYFESVTFSEEDRERAAAYQSNSERLALSGQAGDVGSFIASLDMEVGLAPFDSTSRGRIVQLINKSNQFNLTTRRYTDGDVKALQDDPDILTLQVRVRDRFGDNGMISVVICRPAEAGTWHIDTWLMSCRVLGRGIERVVLKYLVEAARLRGIDTLVGEYIPSNRNDLVKYHYATLGFALRVEAENGGTQWSLPTSADIETPPVRYAATRDRVSAGT